MAIKRHLGVIAMVIPQGPNTTSPFGDFAKNWMFGDSPAAFPRYFHDVTAGIVDISGAEVFGVAVVQDQWLRDQILVRRDRNKALDGAAKVARSIGVRNLRRFDGLIFIIMGAAVDAGGGGVIEDGESIPAALLDDRGSHSFMAHEIAHVLGFHHSFQVTWQNPFGLRYGEYGDPTDIMSAETFGQNSAAFPLPFELGAAVQAGAAFWNSAGPGMSPATLWRYLPGFPQKPEWVHMLPAGSAPTQITLKPAGRSGTTLAVMPRAVGGWWAVEFRTAKGWDRGMTYRHFNPSSSPGVVIHEIFDIGSGYVDPAYPLSQRINYRTTIPVPTSGDNDWVDTGIGVRILQASTDQAIVLMGASIPDHRAVSLATSSTETETARTWAGLVWGRLAGPRCEGALLTLERVGFGVVVVCKITSMGFFDTRYSFAIDGQLLTSPRAATSEPIEGIRNFSVEAMVPVDMDNASPQPRVVPVHWKQFGNTLTVTLPAGLGRYPLKVTGIAQDNTSYKSQGDVVVEIVSETVEYSADSVAQIAECMRYLTSQIDLEHLPPRQLPTMPGPGEEPDWRDLRGIEFAKVIAQLNHPEKSNPFLVDQIRREVGRRVGARTLAMIEAMYRKVAAPAPRKS
jgi:hypothetical protein